MPIPNPFPKPKPRFPDSSGMPSLGLKTKVAPMQLQSEAAKQDKALRDLTKKREAVAKKTGSWPNYYTN